MSLSLKGAYSFAWGAKLDLLKLQGKAVDHTNKTCLFCKQEDGRPPQIGLLCSVCFSCAMENGVVDECMSGTFDMEKFSGGAKRAAGEPVQFQCKYLVTKVDKKLKVVTGPVLVPKRVDLQDDFELPEDIRDAAFGFMEDFRKIGEMHKLFDAIGVPVESWLLREKITVKTKQGTKEYPKGTWMMSVKVENPRTWAKVESGELTGFSIGFTGEREVVKNAA